MLVFDVAQYDGILRKVFEFNSTLSSDQHKRKVTMSNVETARLEALVKTLKDTSHYHSNTIVDVDITLLLHLLESWPDETIFPVFDLLRMAVLHPDGSAGLLKHINSSTGIFVAILKKATGNSSALANFLNSIRAVVNLFKNSAFFGFLQQHRSEILDAYSSCCLTSNKILQLSYSTLLLNYAVLLIEKKDRDGQSQVLSAALEVAEQESVEVDARFRALVAIGSLMLDGSVKQIALDFDVASIAAAARTSKETKIVEIGADIGALIRQN
ncbi:hypothetical protein MLD38_032085 [Melastoma candidum]|uniref:Uncharacterized protein n=1 Tax=Melastoma candidum TaxID=119954 RepID=A0ACB9M2W1_9MYRT|nr:hypothetical protein MLD38_032085 [Melastoma candidum]